MGDRRIRFHGIDAPENGQYCTDRASPDYTCGSNTTQALANKLGSCPVSCFKRDVDRHGRMNATHADAPLPHPHGTRIHMKRYARTDVASP